MKKINIDELCFEESEFLKSVYNDLNNEVDELNKDLELYYEFQKECLQDPRLLVKMGAIEIKIDGHLFAIRDRISLMKDPTFSSSIPEVYKYDLTEQLDDMYSKCKARQEFI